MRPERSPHERVQAFVASVGQRRLLLHVACALTLAVIAGTSVSQLAWQSGTPSIADYRVCPKLDAPATPERVLMAVERLKAM